MCDTRRHHTSATCTIAAVLLTRVVACLRNGSLYEIRDVDGTAVTPAEGQAIVADRYRYPSRTERHDARSPRRAA